ncbi:MAG: DNA polymerase Y family protein, partial [Actinomycetota bacterium]|nr:DNA polymerase Y family protein [Actinomycetota bacterium]
PAPSPTTVPARPLPASVLDQDGAEIVVDGRFRLTGVPANVTVGGAHPRAVIGWSGPWPADERWWEPEAARRRARLQVLLLEKSEEDSQDALLLVRENEKWSVEGIYD